MTAAPLPTNSVLAEPPLDIIVAEDDAITRYRLKAALEAMGHTVRAFSDGRQAWQAYQQRPARIIISDWEMPDLTGPELCQRVRTAGRREYTYFILVTAMKTGEVDYQIASDAGADDFLMKPLTTDGLWRRLRVARRILNFNKEIGELKDLIPTCAYCRQVRDDDDYWSTLEHYVQQHTRSKFSHGICPQCYAKVMRDFEKEKAAADAERAEPHAGEHTCAS